MGDRGLRYVADFRAALGQAAACLYIFSRHVEFSFVRSRRPYLALIEHREFKDHPIEVVTLDLLPGAKLSDLGLCAESADGWKAARSYEIGVARICRLRFILVNDS